MRFVLGCAALCALVTGGCLLWTTYGVPLEAAPTASSHDGLQHVRIVSVDPKALTLTTERIAYYQGPEAVRMANKDVRCEGVIASCVPTLSKGYYIRENGSPHATFPVIEKARVVLLTDRPASLSQLSSYVDAAKTDPVFSVSIISGRITEVKEITHQ